MQRILSRPILALWRGVPRGEVDRFNKRIDEDDGDLEELEDMK